MEPQSGIWDPRTRHQGPRELGITLSQWFWCLFIGIGELLWGQVSTDTPFPRLHGRQTSPPLDEMERAALETPSSRPSCSASPFPLPPGFQVLSILQDSKQRFFQPLGVKGAGCTLLHLSVHGTFTLAPPSAADSPWTRGSDSGVTASPGTQTCISEPC